MRTWDAVKIGRAIKHFLNTEEQVDPIEWLSKPSNIVLENSRGDLGLFEHAFANKTVYSAHYFFKSRGREALTSAHEILDELFNSCYNIGIIMGLTPLHRRAARWFNRQIGCKSHGTEEIGGKEYELFILTKKDFNNE